MLSWFRLLLVLLKDLYVAAINLFLNIFFLSLCPLFCIIQSITHQSIILWCKLCLIPNFNFFFFPLLLDSFYFYFQSNYPQSCFTSGYNTGVYSGDFEVSFVLHLLGKRRREGSREIENNNCFSLEIKYSLLAMYTAWIFLGPYLIFPLLCLYWLAQRVGSK